MASIGPPHPCHGRHHPSVFPAARHIPVEVCENIIDQLYSHLHILEQVDNVRALRCCALVCRDWRVRSQMRLFYSVVLHDTAAVNRLAATLETGPHLSQYVREVMLIGRTLQTTANPLSHFPVALCGKLPRLEMLRVTHIGDSNDDIDLYPKASGPEIGQRLRFLPLHPHFPHFLSAFTTITSLCIVDATFQSFNDLLRLVISLPGLRLLECIGVRCAALGPLPPNMRLQNGASIGPEILQLVCTLPHERDLHLTSCS